MIIPVLMTLMERAIIKNLFKLTSLFLFVFVLKNETMEKQEKEDKIVS